MQAISLLSVDKLLDSVLGFRPTEADMQLMVKAEAITGKKRSDILRACFYRAIGPVVDALEQQRQQSRSDFDTTLTTVLKLTEGKPGAIQLYGARPVKYPKPTKPKPS